MTASLRALLHGFLDYAGLFPPAALAMPEAAAAFAGYRTHPERWMLSRFVCPAARVPELLDAARGLADPPPDWDLSILTGGGDSGPESIRNLTRDLDLLAGLRRGGARFTTGAAEIRIPEGIAAGSPADMDNYFGAVQGRMAASGAGCRTVFFEVSLGPRWPERLPRLGDALTRTAPGRLPAFGLKIRTGGLEPAAFPTPEEIAAFLLAARDTGLPIKATAGLHHPIRHENRSIGVWMHGFLNVFLAAAAAHAGTEDPKQLAAMIRETDPSAFRFEAEQAGWGRIVLTREQIEAARRDFIISEGSCSFEEPVEDLTALGLLEPQGNPT